MLPFMLERGDKKIFMYLLILCNNKYRMINEKLRRSIIYRVGWEEGGKKRGKG